MVRSTASNENLQIELTKEDIWDKEYAQYDVPLNAVEIQIVHHAFNLRISDVCSIEMRYKI